MEKREQRNVTAANDDESAVAPQASTIGRLREPVVAQIFEAFWTFWHDRPRTSDELRKRNQIERFIYLEIPT